MEQKQQEVSIDAFINGIVGGLIEFGQLIKNDKARTAEAVAKLKDEINTLKKGQNSSEEQNGPAAQESDEK